MLWKWVEDKNDLLPPHSKNDGDSFDNNWEFITSSMLAGAALHIAVSSPLTLYNSYYPIYFITVGIQKKPFIGELWPYRTDFQ